MTYLTDSRWVDHIQPGISLYSGNGFFPVSVDPPSYYGSLYRLVFQEGSSVLVGGQEKLRLYRKHSWYKGNSDRVYSADQLYYMGESDYGGDLVLPVIRVSFPSRPLPLDPYLLGILLGDGTLVKGVSFTTSDPEIVERVSGVIPPETHITHNKNSPYDYHIRVFRGCRNPVTDILRSLGVHGQKAATKSVPDLYLFNDEHCRLSVLQGLMDTDGYLISGGRAGAELGSNSQKLASDVAFLVQSLGGTVRIRNKITNSANLHWVANLNMPKDLCPFRLSRKRDNFHHHEKYRPIRILRKVEFLGIAGYQLPTVLDPYSVHFRENFIPILGNFS